MKRLICIILLCAGFISAMAQDVYYSSGKKNGYRKKTETKGYDPDKLILGGNLNVGYGTDPYGNQFVNFGVTPLIGYRFSNYLAAGFGLGYQYYKFPDPNVIGLLNGVYATENIVFPSVWAKVKVWGPLFVTSDFEYAISSIKSHNISYDTLGNQFLTPNNFVVGVPCLLVGAGYKYHIGGRASLVFELMYDVLQEQYSPYYGTLVYRGGLYFGL